MSTTRTINIKTVDDTTAVMLGVMRTIRSVRTEIRMTEMFMRALEAAEIAASEGALTLGVAMQMIVPILGMVAAAIGILAGISITERRAAIPVAQGGGLVTSTGIAVIEEDERIIPPGGSVQGAAGGNVKVNVNITLDPAGMDITQIGSPIGQAVKEAVRGLNRRVLPY